MKINITDEALAQLNILNIKNIKIIFHGQGCGGPVLSMIEGKPDLSEHTLKVGNFTFALKQELAEKFEFIDIDYSNCEDEGFTVEADNCGGCIKCNGCWLNTIEKKFQKQ